MALQLLPQPGRLRCGPGRDGERCRSRASRPLTWHWRIPTRFIEEGNGARRAPPSPGRAALCWHWAPGTRKGGEAKGDPYRPLGAPHSGGCGPLFPPRSTATPVKEPRSYTLPVLVCRQRRPRSLPQKGVAGAVGANSGRPKTAGGLPESRSRSPAVPAVAGPAAAGRGAPAPPWAVAPCPAARPTCPRAPHEPPHPGPGVTGLLPARVPAVGQPRASSPRPLTGCLSSFTSFRSCSTSIFSLSFSLRSSMLMAGIVYTANARREGKREGGRTKGYRWAARPPGPEPPGGRGAAGRWDGGRPRPAPGAHSHGAVRAAPLLGGGGRFLSGAPGTPSPRRSGL